MTHDVERVGDRVEELLATLRSGEDREVAEELVRLLMDLYGTGLARVVAILAEHTPALLAEIAADELVESLLLLHDLHPDDMVVRIRRALAGLGHGVEYVGVDDGVVRLRLRTDGGGCGSGVQSAVRAVERVVLDAAPEAAAVEIAVVSTTLLQIGMEPPPGWGVAS